MSLADGHIWFVFGVSHDGQTADIADAENSTLIAGLPIDLARQVEAAHNNAVFIMESQHYARITWNREHV
jgi:hypothetical protein